MTIYGYEDVKYVMGDSLVSHDGSKFLPSLKGILMQTGGLSKCLPGWLNRIYL